MKKLGFVLFYLVLIISYAQAQNNNEKKLIDGSWIDIQTNQVWNFNANNTIALINGKVAEYVVAGGKLAIIDGTSNNWHLIIFNYYISSDGKNLILEWSSGQSWDTVTGKSFCFKKK